MAIKAKSGASRGRRMGASWPRRVTTTRPRYGRRAPAASCSPWVAINTLSRASRGRRMGPSWPRRGAAERPRAGRRRVAPPAWPSRLCLEHRVVAEWEQAGHGEWRHHGQGVGGGQRPRAAHPEWPQGFFAQETLVDEIACELGMDPLEIHRHNVIRLGDTDLLSAQLGEGKEGLPRLVRSCGLPQCMESAARAIGWAQKRKKFPNGHSHLRRGVGMACTMQGSGIAGVDWASAFLKMNEDGSFYLQVGASDVGGGADTVLSQIAAETLGVSLDKIVITSGDTDITPFDVGAYASSTTIISGGAVKKVAGKVRAQVLELASKMLAAPVDQLDCGNNEVFTTCVCRKSVSMSDLAMQAMYREKLQIMDGASHFNTDSPPPFCATFAEVEVDTETGQVRVVHLATAVD